MDTKWLNKICLPPQRRVIGDKARNAGTAGAVGDSVRPAKLEGAVAARIVVDLLGMAGKPWLLAIDRTYGILAKRAFPGLSNTIGVVGRLK